MANTIMTAKNSFGEGLIMDFAPDNTQATCMTSALNATLLTFNGNEMTLLNDMGNGRVETAFLPEGYIPVGTCEFGDIIYIVSYNPIINKSLIGCFPSPERNISSEEVGGLNLNLSWTDFLETDDGKTPNGKIKASSVKKIIFEKGLSPGDKYFIYTNSNELQNNSDKISDIGNVLHLYGDYPKLLRLHVVAIEDSGKINYLDSTVKWYDKAPSKLDYFLQELSSTSEKTPDLDSYRNLISDAYTVFLSKVSGKLAILAELEKITGFSCTHSVYTSEGRIEENENGSKNIYTNYDIYLHTSWTTDDFDINPSGYVILDSNFINGNGYKTYKGNKELKIENIAIDKFNDIYSRHYKIEDSGTYEDYVRTYSYDKIKEDFISYYAKDKDNNYIPNKITLLRTNNNYSSIFVYNANNSDDKGYYFTNNIGVKLYVHYLDPVEDIKHLENKYKFDLSTGNIKLWQTDSFIHNYFNTDITKSYYSTEILLYVLENGVKYYSNLTDLIHLYTICPAMPYGYLEEYSITNSIDFGKINSGLINLNEWRYYNDGLISTLTFGIEAYPENGKGISKIELEFYDNNGKTGIITISGRKSYSGTFTQILSLDTENAIDTKNGEITHLGTVLDLLENIDLTVDEEGNSRRITAQEVVDRANSLETLGDNDLDNLAFLYRNKLLVLSDNFLYQSDAGILYSNWLYLVKIKVYYLNYNSLGTFDEDPNLEPIIFERWFWTNNMWNEHYHNLQDYDSLLPEITVAVQGAFKENENFKLSPSLSANPVYNSDDTRTEGEQSLSYSLYKIEHSNKPNINLALVPMLADSYETFLLFIEPEDPENPKENQTKLNYTLYEGPSEINVTVPNKVYPEGITHVELSDLIEPKKRPEIILENDINLYDYFSLEMSPKSNQTGKEVEYINTLGEKLNTKGFLVYNYTADLFFERNGEVKYTIDLNIEGEFYSKIMGGRIEEKSVYYPQYSPILQKEDQLEELNLTISNTSSDDKGSTSYFSFLEFYDITTGEYGGPGLFLGKTFDNGLLNIDEGYPIVKKSGNKGHYVSYSLESFINEASSNIKGSFLPIMWLNNIDKEGDNTITKCSNTSTSSISSEWVRNWGLTYDNNAVLCGAEETDFSGGENGVVYIKEFSIQGAVSAYVMSLAVLSGTKTWKPINCFCRMYCYKQNNTYYVMQRFGHVNHYSSTTNSNALLHVEGSIGGFTSLAGIIASLLSLIYVFDGGSKEKIMRIFTQPLVNESYIEKWNKDIVVLTTCDNIEDLLTIHHIPLNNYLSRIKKYKSFLGENISNITFKFDSTTSLVKFEHDCTYDISKLLSEFSFNTNTTGAYINPDISNTYSGGYIDIADKLVLYLDVKNNKIQDSPKDIILYPLNTEMERDTSYHYDSVKMTDFILDTSGSGFMKIKNNQLIGNFSGGTESMRIKKDSADNDDDGAYFSYSPKYYLRLFAI